MEKGGEGRER